MTVALHARIECDTQEGPETADRKDSNDAQMRNIKDRSIYWQRAYPRGMGTGDEITSDKRTLLAPPELGKWRGERIHRATPCEHLNLYILAEWVDQLMPPKRIQHVLKLSNASIT